jgi:hypothetical protein
MRSMVEGLREAIRPVRNSELAGQSGSVLSTMLRMVPLSRAGEEGGRAAPACISPSHPLHARLITHVDVRAGRGEILISPFRSLEFQGFVRGGDNRKKDTTHGSSRVLHAPAA